STAPFRARLRVATPVRAAAQQNRRNRRGGGRGTWVIRGPVEAAGAVDAQNAPTAPWKTTEQVFHSYHKGFILIHSYMTEERRPKALTCPRYRGNPRSAPCSVRRKARFSLSAQHPAASDAKHISASAPSTLQRQTRSTVRRQRSAPCSVRRKARFSVSSQHPAASGAKHGSASALSTLQRQTQSTVQRQR